jgi:hypothetical protein
MPRGAIVGKPWVPNEAHIHRRACVEAARTSWAKCGVGSSVIAHFVSGEFGKIQRTEFGQTQSCSMTYHSCKLKDIPSDWIGREITSPSITAHFSKNTCFRHGRSR